MNKQINSGLVTSLALIKEHLREIGGRECLKRQIRGEIPNPQSVLYSTSLFLPVFSDPNFHMYQETLNITQPLL